MTEHPVPIDPAALDLAALTPTSAGAVAREQAEIQSAYLMALHRPRDEKEARVKLREACSSPALVENGLWAFPRGGETLSGISVYLAREMARIWGNIRSGSSCVERNEEALRLRGWAVDLETNARSEEERVVQRKIPRKRGGRTVMVEPEPRDEVEMIGRECAKLERNAVLKVLPAALREEARAWIETAGEQKVKADRKGGAKTMAEQIVSFFAAYGVGRPSLEVWLSCSVEEATDAQIAQLKTVGQSLKAGADPADYFGGDDPDEHRSSAESRVRAAEDAMFDTQETKTP